MKSLTYIADDSNSTAEATDTSTVSTEAQYRVLAFKKKAPPPPEGYTGDLRILYTQSKSRAAPRARTTRHIPTAPERILDAPELIDDYYLNLLDWSQVRRQTA